MGKVYEKALRPQEGHACVAAVRGDTEGVETTKLINPTRTLPNLGEGNRREF